MNGLYWVPFSQLPQLPIKLCVTTGLSCLPIHGAPVPCVLLPDLTPLVPSGLRFALSTHRHPGMPPGRRRCFFSFCSLYTPTLEQLTYDFAFVYMSCLLTMENNMRTRTITFQL